MPVISLNIFSDDGVVVDTTTAELTLDQISDIIDHAAQLILNVRNGQSGVDLSELEEALVVAGVID